MKNFIVRVSSKEGSIVACEFESPEPIKKVAAWISGLLGKASVEVDDKGRIVQDGNAARPILYAIPRQDMGVLLSTMRELIQVIQEANKLARHNPAQEADDDSSTAPRKLLKKERLAGTSYIG